MSSLLGVLPVLLVSPEENHEKSALQHCEDELPSPQVSGVELVRWRHIWLTPHSSAVQDWEDHDH